MEEEEEDLPSMMPPSIFQLMTTPVDEYYTPIFPEATGDVAATRIPMVDLTSPMRKPSNTGFLSANLVNEALAGLDVTDVATDTFHVNDSLTDDTAPTAAMATHDRATSVALSQYKGTNVLDKAVNLCQWEEVLYHMYISLMDLFEKIVYNYNPLSLVFIHKHSDRLHLKYDDLLQVAFMQTLPFPVRSSAMRLLVSLYLGSGSPQLKPKSSLLRCWTDTTTSRNETSSSNVLPSNAMSKQTNAQYATLEMLLLNGLEEVCAAPVSASKTNSMVDERITGRRRLRFVISSEHVKPNLYVTSLLAALKQLLKLKHSDESGEGRGPRSLWGTLVQLLDGRWDVKTQSNDASSRFETSTIANPVIEAKMILLEILQHLLTLRLHDQIGVVFTTFGQNLKTKCGNDVFDKPTTLDNRDLYSEKNGGSDGHFEQLETRLFLPWSDTESICERQLRIPCDVDRLGDFPHILFDLLRYEHRPLVVGALEVLLRYFTQKVHFNNHTSL